MIRTCSKCRAYNFNAKENTGECRLHPPVRLPRRFAADATAESRVRNEEIRWSWPNVKTWDWCADFRKARYPLE